MLSLTSSLMAVYYTTTQQRMLGRLLQAEQVRLWIRGGSRAIDTARLVPSFDEIVLKFVPSLKGNSQRLVSSLDVITEWIGYRLSRQFGLGEQYRTYQQAYFEARLLRIEEARANDQRDPVSEGTHYNFNIVLRLVGRFIVNTMGWIRPDFLPSEPDDFNPTQRDRRNLKRSIVHQCFTPSASSVITVSAPQMLLTTSLCSLLIGFGIYFGFRWTRSLDQTAGPNDSRNVLITYITSLVVSTLVYSISQLFQDDDKRTELAIMEDYLKEYVEHNPETVRNWGVRAEIVKGVLNFHSIEPESSRRTAYGTEQNPQGNGSLYSIGIELEDLPPVERGVGSEIVEGVPHFHYTEAHSSRGTTSETEQNPQEDGSLYGRD